MITKEKIGTIGKTNVEMCLEILELLFRSVPCKLAQAMKKMNANCCTVRVNLDFLIKQGLIETKIIGKKRKYYVITPLGATVLEQFKKLKEFPRLDEIQIEAKTNEKQFVFCSNSLANVSF
ncbi:MAG: winged helix-turn-helix domain-containing protein [Candidatus Bathyarchaeia archaeon]